MAKSLSELTDAELLAVAVGQPTLAELTDEQLLNVAVQQGRVQEEEAGEVLRERKRAERAPVADAVAAGIAQSSFVPVPVARALLTRGGFVGDIAAGVAPTLGGSIAGSPAGLPGVMGGGSAGATVGEGLVQTRQFFRGERDEIGGGRFLGAAAAGAIPLGRPVVYAGQAGKTLGMGIVRRGAQGAAVSTGAELTGQVIDEGEIDLQRLAATGALGFLLGGAFGGAEQAVLRQQVLAAVRRTPQYRNFKGSDADLVADLRQRPEAKPVAPDVPAEQQFLERTGLPPRPTEPGSPRATPPATPRVPGVEPPPSGGAAETAPPAVPDNLPPTESPAAPPPLSTLSDEQLLALAADAAPGAQSPAPPAGVEVPSSGESAAEPTLPPVAGGQAPASVPAPAPPFTPEAPPAPAAEPPKGYRLVRTYDDPTLAAAARDEGIKKGSHMLTRQLPDGRAELWFKPKGRTLKIGPPPDADRDLLNDIEELGGIGMPKPDGFGYDGFAAAFNQGKARLLRRRGGNSPDSLVEQLNLLGARDLSERGIYNFQSVDDFYQAVINAARAREKMARDWKRLEHEKKIEEALFANTGRKNSLAARKPVNSDTLNVGDTFEVRGEPRKVIAIDPDTNSVIVRNGGDIVIPPGTLIYPDKGRVKRAAKKQALDENMPFEDPKPYGAAHARYLQLRAAEKAGTLDAAGQAELDRVERGLGQDFLDFYTGEKGGAPTLLADADQLAREEMRRRADAPLQAADLQSQVDLFGPTTDKKGQFELFERTANRYLDARQVKHPSARIAVRGILAGVWERQLARQLELDLATDATLAATLDPAPGRLPDAAGQPRPTDGMGRSVDALPNAQLGAHAGGLQLEARLYTQAFLADGFLEHTGRKFASPAELISAAQVLRNRNVETFWVLPYDAEDRLLAPFAFSSRLPNTVQLGEGYERRLRAMLARLGAARFDVLHNHPSGAPRPSMADREFTHLLKKEFRNFGQHYVINHGTYSVIRGAWDFETNLTLPDIVGRPDPTARPQGSSPYLGREINSSAALALGYELQVPAGNITLFFLNSDNVLTATGSVAPADLAALDFAAHLRNLSRGVGAINVIAYYDGAPEVSAVLRDLNDVGVLAEVFAVGTLRNGERAVLRKSQATPFRLYDNTASAAWRVAEEATPLSPEGEAQPPAPTHFVSKFDKTPVPQPLGQMHLVRPVEMPELVNLVKLLAGSFPRLKRLPSSHGLMHGVGPGRITLDRRIFSDPVFATQVLAHELGHLIDYLPDRTLARGNLLGRLASLRDYLANSLPLKPGGAGPLTPKERAKIRREAEKAVGKRPPADEEADLAAWQEDVRQTYSELIQAELATRGLVVAKGRSVEGGSEVTGVGDIGTELSNLSFWWRPLPEAAPDSYFDYRNSAKEIYADALSVLFNAPAEFRDRAPTAWQMFFNYLDRKPEAKAELFATWDLLHQGAQAVSAARVRNLRTGFARADEVLLRKAEERAGRRNSLPAIIEHFKQKHFNLYAPIIDKVRAARAAGRPVNWAEDPEFVFDAHPLAENANYRFLDRVQKTVLSPIEDLGLDADTLGDYLFFNRVAHESYLVGEQQAGRVTLANPLGHTPITARRELLVLRYRLGPQRFEAMQAAARRFQDLALEVIERGHASGIYSDAQLALARDNRHNYAAFAVVDFLEQSPHIPAGFRQQQGTLREIANPFLSTVIKMMTANKFAELNQAKRVSIQFLTRHFPGEVALAPVTKIPLASGKLMFRAKRPPDGKRELVVMDGGRPVTWHVEPDIATMFEHNAPASAHAIVGVTNWAFRNIFYPAFITYNPAFQLYANPIRDLSRSYVKLPPGVKRRHWLDEQLRANRGARARLLNNITGEDLRRRRDLRALANRRDLTDAEQAELQLLDDRALAIEVLVQRGITTPFEAFASNPMRGDTWGAMLAEYRLANTGEQSNAMRRWADFLPGLGTLLDKIEFAGQTAEAMPKLGAYRVLTRELGWPAPKAAYFIRNHIGTPNFTKRGQWTTWDGTIFPFINIFIRGLESDVAQMRGRIPGVPVDPRSQRSSYWRRMAERTLIPRTLQALAATGLLGAGLKKYYDAWSEYNKANYLILPLGTVHDGKGDFGYKSVGLRIPEDETARLLGGIVHHVVQLAANDDPAASASLANLVNFAGGQVPGINPVLTLADGWMQYSSGINPRDRLRGNPVLSDAEFKAGGWHGLTGMAAWTWDEVGLGNFVRYDPKAQTWQEHAVGSLPVLSRAIKITDTGLRERQRTLEADLDARNARIRLAMPDIVNQLLAEHSRLTAIRREHRTPVQQLRLDDLSYWHTHVWMPTYEQLQETDPRLWHQRGEALGQISASIERR